MAQIKGNNLTRNSLLSAFGRTVGFVLLASLSMGLLGLLVLLPPYAELHQQKKNLYELQQRIFHAEKIRDANERLKEVLPTDKVITERLVKHKAPSELLKTGSVTVNSLPDPWWLPAAGKLSNPPLRRGLFLLSAITLGVAFFMFSPPSTSVKTP